MATKREKRFVVKEDKTMKYDAPLVDVRVHHRALSRGEFERIFHDIPDYIPDEQIIKYVKFRESKK